MFSQIELSKRCAWIFCSQAGEESSQPATKQTSNIQIAAQPNSQQPFQGPLRVKSLQCSCFEVMEALLTTLDSLVKGYMGE